MKKTYIYIAFSSIATIAYSNIYAQELDISGRWRAETSHSSYSQTLLISQESKDIVKFKISANSGGNTCDVEGTAKVKDNGDIDYKDKSDCKIHFSLSKDNSTYNITSKNCSGYCGLGAEFDGDYHKNSGGHTEDNNYFVEQNVLSKKNLNTFFMLVGDWYKEFYDSMSQIYETKNLDKFDANVHSGGVRGMYTINEAIIMENEEGNIWAAVIHDDKVFYFTNSQKYEDQLPVTIDDWRERFSEKEVVFVKSK